ncbi:hypothetical protein M2401_006815 [Pseudomonas sp. JUb42]|uniref:DUF4214 domain-containing protein n=1 Tax=Pseudomonas sp. JUb42 TaxID=2940611 RepID=UPI0021682662|nr:DUF4214 domain-containing protein [Pseudomonas sp. JUb42]MCS3473047.1 hypothetical protein [Pseudomonas sp. JUb42]
MSNLTLDQAKTVAATAYEKYFPASYGMNLNNHSQLFSAMDAYYSQAGLSPENTLKKLTADILYFAAIDNPAAFPGYTVVIGPTDAKTFVESLPSSMVINFLYPQASADTKAAMTTALDTGAISKENFTFGITKLGTTNTAPTLADVTKAATVAGLPTSYPDSGLHVPGVTSSQQDMIVALYDATFSRAPENGGLIYWANKLNVELSYGTDQTTAYSVVSKQMYIDGKGNGEAGTTLGDSAYVNFAYQNILGRAGDAAGVSYWNDKLATGAVDRGTFVAKFVGDAINNAGDSDFLQARIAVSKYAAQAHVSGPGAPGIDLHAVIQNVSDAASANAAINAIIQKYGTAASPHALDAVMASWTDAPVTASAQDATVSTAVELTGAASHSAAYDAFGLAA